VSTVQVMLQNRRLEVAGTLPEAATLVSELQGFQMKFTAAASVQYEAWREGVHDDLVLAVALAVYVGEHRPGPSNFYLHPGARGRHPGATAAVMLATEAPRATLPPLTAGTDWASTARLHASVPRPSSGTCGATGCTRGEGGDAKAKAWGLWGA
jgi:hypothetical protein